MMNSTKGPKLNHRAASPTSRDNLGITSAQTSLQDELCPVVNTVTYRAFYWPFLVWNYYTCIRNTPKSKLCEKNIGDFFNVEYVKRNDFYFILGTLLNKDADHQNLAGIDNGRAALKSAGPYQYNDKYLQAYFGGMQYYGGGCDTLGFITGREQDSTPIPGLARLTESVGKPMGEASMSCWTTLLATAISPMFRRGDSDPATPMLMTRSGWYLRIIVWAHIPANTLPTPHVAHTTSTPWMLPRTKLVPLISAV